MLICCRHLPLARDVVRLARQQLVHRLDSYMSRKNEPVFRRVLALVDTQVRLQWLPAVRVQGSGSSRLCAPC